MLSLKDFQRDTAAYAFRRLWTDEDATNRFLVADEVGLGKTMVAKGVIAQAVEYLQDPAKRNGDAIDVIYVCSNNQIAQQNLNRLNVVGGREIRHADRLTLLPEVLPAMKRESEGVNFISFTPGTSLAFGSHGGDYRERSLLLRMLSRGEFGISADSPIWQHFFQGGMTPANFAQHLEDARDREIDDALCQGFLEALGTSFIEELGRCSVEFDRDPREFGPERDQLIRHLRTTLARVAIDHLEPDLVVLDEFQRFKDLFDPDNPAGELTRTFLNYPRVKVLMLSATPYKMYTLPDEPDGEDHYRDFVKTIEILGGSLVASRVEDCLRTMREALMTGERERSQSARDEVQRLLRKYMCRTERLASTPDRDGMLRETASPAMVLTADDLRSWRRFRGVAHASQTTQDVYDYWLATPYPLNLMDRNSYQVRIRVDEALTRGESAVTALLREAPGLLQWDQVHNNQPVPAGNAKMRSLIADVVDRGAWQLAWVPPSLPYYELGGAYAEPSLQRFTKRLVFSAWTVVPKAISVLVSYEADRRAIEAGGIPRAYDVPRKPLLRFQLGANGRPSGMPTFALLYPSFHLARLGDSLVTAQQYVQQLPMGREHLLRRVQERVEDALAKLPSADENAATDARWYWAAPLLMDHLLGEELEFRTGTRDPLAAISLDATDEEGLSSAGFEKHLELARGVRDLELGRRPDDLPQVLSMLAVAGPGVCALRALERVTGGYPHMREPRRNAFWIANGLRGLFNRPELINLLSTEEDHYWRAVLGHCLDGGLEAVLDEYFHVLVESEGLQDAGHQQRCDRLTDVCLEALGTRTAVNTVTVFDEVESERRMSSHFAARFGRVQTEKADMRETTVRTAFNSPFRPFVLASTSVGQEGLDFHTYSHAVVHWNLPSNPVDLEQREGRVHRYKGHAVRKNVARAFGTAALDPLVNDPWSAVFEAAVADRDLSANDLIPYWVFTRPSKDGTPTYDPDVIERYVPALPLSRELQQYHRLQRTLGAYRMVMGQPRQEDLVRYVGSMDADMTIDLTPPSSRI